MKKNKDRSENNDLKLNNDEVLYYQKIKKNILSDSHLFNILSRKEQESGFKRIMNRFKLDPKQFKNLEEAIREVAPRCSCRALSETVLARSNPLCGDQYMGRDLKRWAAIQLKELFEEKALLKESGEFWHEF